jgi:hypothetical protein
MIFTIQMRSRIYHFIEETATPTLLSAPIFRGLYTHRPFRVEESDKADIVDRERNLYK